MNLRAMRASLYVFNNCRLYVRSAKGITQSERDALVSRKDVNNLELGMPRDVRQQELTGRRTGESRHIIIVRVHGKGVVWKERLGWEGGRRI